MFHEPRDLLIECKSCGAESRFKNYVPEKYVVCGQCQESLIDLDLNDSHDEYVCEDCGYTQLLMKDTPFDLDETACRCGSDNIVKMDSSSIAEEAEEAGTLDKLDDDIALSDDETLDEEEEDEGEEEPLEEEDEDEWLHSDPNDESDDRDETSDSEKGYC